MSLIIFAFFSINLSMTSLKIKHFIKQFLRNRRKSSYTLLIGTNEEPRVLFRGSEIFFELKVTSDKTKNGMRNYKECLRNEKFDTLWIYSENLIDEWMNLVKVVKEIFKFKKHTVIFKIDQFPTKNKSIIDFIKSLTPSIECCEFRGVAETDKDV